MIVDVRTYTLHPGSLGAFFKLYEGEGFVRGFQPPRNALHGSGEVVALLHRDL